jgi:CelD/BcsL family acetyltransferase involved in cellulose biosynthesis
VQARVIRSVEELEALTPVWVELADTCGARATSYPWWCLPWWRHVGRGRLHVVVVEEQRQLCGLLPLFNRHLARLSIIHLLGHAYGTVSRLLALPGTEEEVGRVAWRALFDQGFGYARLDGFEASPEAGIHVLERSQVPHRVQPHDVCPTIPLSGSFDDYWSARDKALRRTLRRADRLLAEKDLRYTFEVVTASDRLDDVLGPVTNLYEAAQRLIPRRNLLGGQSGDFTRSLLAAAAVAGRLRLFLGWIGDELASFDIGLMGARSLALWAGRIEPEHRAFSPGHVALRAIIGHAYSEGVPELDLLLGDEHYKRQWSDNEYTTVTVEAASSPALLLAGRAGLAGAGRLRRRAR